MDWNYCPGMYSLLLHQQKLEPQRQLPMQPLLASKSSATTYLSVPDNDYTTHFLINPKPGPDTLMWGSSPLHHWVPN